jgi:small GTP-binding protein
VKVGKEQHRRDVRIQVWDTAGQERFKSISAQYITGKHAIMLVYDSSDRRSFENLWYWQDLIHQHADDGVPLALVANKSDVLDAWNTRTGMLARMTQHAGQESWPEPVSREEGQARADALNIPFFVTSAKVRRYEGPHQHACTHLHLPAPWHAHTRATLAPFATYCVLPSALRCVCGVCMSCCTNMT